MFFVILVISSTKKVFKHSIEYRRICNNLLLLRSDIRKKISYRIISVTSRRTYSLCAFVSNRLCFLSHILECFRYKCLLDCHMMQNESYWTWLCGSSVLNLRFIVCLVFLLKKIRPDDVRCILNRARLMHRTWFFYDTIFCFHIYIFFYKSSFVVLIIVSFVFMWSANKCWRIWELG